MTDPTKNQAPADLFIVSSPSGGGKTTLINQTIARFRKQGIELYFSVSHTTRTPRSGEEQGREYHFVDRPKFEAMIAEDGFLEHATVHDNQYGTSRQPVVDSVDRGIDVILDIDVQGARMVKTKWRGHEPVKIFVFPPSYEELKRRLQQRGLDDPAVIERRLRNAGREFAEYGEYNHVIINDDLERAVRELESIIISRRIRPDRQQIRLDFIVGQFQKHFADR